MNNKSKAVFLMLLSALGFAFMAAMVKLAGDIPLAEKVFFRNLVSFIVVFVASRNSGESLICKKENFKYVLARSLLGLTGVFLYFYSINNLYLADSSMINKLSPIFIIIFAAIFLKEKLNAVKIISMVVAFIGVLLVIKPQWDLSILPAASGLLSAAFAGGAYTMVRYLKDKEKPATIVFYFSLISVVGTFPLVLLNFSKPTLNQLIYLILIGIFAAIAQIALTYSYKYAPASEVAVYNYTNIIFSAILGFIIWQETPDALSIVGGIIIILVALVVYLYNKKNDN
ncbi:DMT family transporter [Clostridium oceanicum]|uniref:DMT family transporter n=1 Tax=Clostridium oceanicum TaxID=1543 RepID=A0ABN1JGC1_9CLOT